MCFVDMSSANCLEAFLCIVFRRGFLLGWQPCTPIWWRVRRMVWPLTSWLPTSSIPTIDYQHLNSQCKHHTGSPFQLALQVPPKQKKTVLDAVDGYHSVPLDKTSQPLTTFITEWGRFMYLRMPQGSLASGDAYTRRYDEVIKDIPRKVKIMDDTMLYDPSIEESFYHTFDFLLHCAKNGIVLNRDKFQFCQDTVQFGGLQITPSGVTPSKPMLEAILNFSIPKTLTQDHGSDWSIRSHGRTHLVQSCSPSAILLNGIHILLGTRASKLYSNIPNRS